MVNFLERALELQNFYSRLSQYKDLKPIPNHPSDCVNVKRVLSKHKITGKKYVIKSVEKKRGVYPNSKNEIKVLLECKKRKIRAI